MRRKRTISKGSRTVPVSKGYFFFFSFVNEWHPQNVVTIFTLFNCTLHYVSPHKSIHRWGYCIAVWSMVFIQNKEEKPAVFPLHSLYTQTSSRWLLGSRSYHVHNWSKIINQVCFDNRAGNFILGSFLWLLLIHIAGLRLGPRMVVIFRTHCWSEYRPVCPK